MFPMCKRAEVWISGRVQMVGFRYFIKMHAHIVRVSGSIENTSDNRVHAVFEGTEKQINKMLKICKAGSPLSKVKDIKVVYSEPINITGFKIIGIGLFGK
jgi:acylphosphatase